LRTLACSLEVSPNRGLIADDGAATLIAALRPDLFRRANLDIHNPRALLLNNGIDRNFQAGEDTVATDDNGNAQSLALTPNTDYYYRIMCGGATERGMVHTLPDVPSIQANFDVTVYLKPVIGTQVRIRYGGLTTAVASLTTTAVTPCPGNCSLKLPWTPGRALMFYVDELNASNQVVLGAPRQIVVPSP
jgi:hypothetical protein